jgi:hypothetical protein
MKPLIAYLLAVFLLTCGLLFIVTAIDPPEPIILIEGA